MSRPAEQSITIFCDGGCGKSQSVRPSRIDRRYTHIGCGRCGGCDRIRASYDYPRPDTILVHDFQVPSGFEGLRLRIAAVEERASMAEAQALVRSAQHQGLI